MSEAGANRPSWKLRPPVDSATQGLVVSGFGSLETGRALFLECGPEATGGAWLRDLAKVAPVTNAAPPPKDKPSSRAAAMAFAWTGLQRLGLDESALASFSRPFREGMFQEDRLRRLGDRRSGEWTATVIEGGPKWSANTPLRTLEGGLWGAHEVPDGGHVEEWNKTPITVHALLLLYTRDEADADVWVSEVGEALRPHGVAIVHQLPLVLNVIDGGRISREHFGFNDGLSQPEPYDEDGAVTLAGAPVGKGQDKVQGVPLGEVLIGYLNGHHEKAPGPVVPDDAQGRPAAAGLKPHAEAEGYFDFGLNGSYMVVRELRQHVAEFWNSMDRNAARIREQDPENSAHVTADWLAERAVGRNRDGHLLCPGTPGTLDPDCDNYPVNDFLFYEKDAQGLGCPPGSHVRRSNPRDALAPNPASREALLEAANNHRILRRGRKFGNRIADERVPDGENRGLLFVCLNTDIARQFEFVQQTWLLNSNFATLFGETDPLVGPPGRMTIREEPLRRTVHVDTFVEMAGGDYFFLPSMNALDYLRSL